MGQESKKGSEFYKSKGLKPVTLHLPIKAHKKLRELAKREERSLQVTARRILMDYLGKIKFEN